MNASRLVVMGYSAPVTDLSVAALIGNYVDPNVPTTVVDTCPDPIVQRLRVVGLRNVTAVDTADPIPRFADTYERDAAAKVAAPLLALISGNDFDPRDPAIARIEHPFQEPRLPITEIKEVNGVTEFVSTELRPGQVLDKMAVEAGRVRQAVEHAAAAGQPLVLRVPGQPVRAVLHIARRVHNRYLLGVES